jgi:hypothetical protein
LFIELSYRASITFDAAGTGEQAERRWPFGGAVNVVVDSPVCGLPLKSNGRGETPYLRVRMPFI